MLETAGRSVEVLVQEGLPHALYYSTTAAYIAPTAASSPSGDRCSYLCARERVPCGAPTYTR